MLVLSANHYDVVTHAGTSFLQYQKGSSLSLESIMNFRMTKWLKHDPRIKIESQTNLYKPRAWRSAKIKQANNKAWSKIIDVEGSL